MIEIERKFLLADLPDLQQAQAVAIRQGYITGPQDSAAVRLRQRGTAYFLTVKSGAGLARAECESEITEAQFQTFWPLTAGRRIEKTRWTGHLDSGALFELDLFEGALAPLRVVEVEFDSIAAAKAFQPPAWFGRDVTSDPDFSNKSLAAKGLPQGFAP